MKASFRVLHIVTSMDFGDLETFVVKVCKDANLNKLLRVAVMFNSPCYQNH